jgi:hypothetical protein
MRLSSSWMIGEDISLFLLANRTPTFTAIVKHCIPLVYLHQQRVPHHQRRAGRTGWRLSKNEEERLDRVRSKASKAAEWLIRGTFLAGPTIETGHDGCWVDHRTRAIHHDTLQMLG